MPNLILGRHLGESITVDGPAKIQVLAIYNEQGEALHLPGLNVKLAVVAPARTNIVRTERLGRKSPD